MRPRATASCRWSWHSSSTCCRGSRSAPRSRCRGSPAASADGDPARRSSRSTAGRTRERLTRLQRELKKLAAQRENRRQRRGRRAVPVLSIVGYTNAGKSTLLRALTRTEVHVADQMFATLDPTSRRLRFPREREVIVTDTVGFIRDLPPDLVTAFGATLEELADASLLLHVVDAAAADCERRIEAVRRVLQDIGLQGAGAARLQPDRPAGSRRGRCAGAPPRGRRGVRAPAHRPAKPAGARRRDALDGRRGRSESVVIGYRARASASTSSRVSGLRG